LHHDGDAYVAEVPELPGCRGTGACPAAALQAAQGAIAAWLQRAARAGTAAPALQAPADLARSIRERLAAIHPEPKHIQRMSPVKLLLVKKFGKMSNRELAGRIGLTGRDAPTMLSAAASGKGTRKARCAIALALGVLPSRLWPDRQAAIYQDDDDLFDYFKKQG
jgi:predicted RNase H-like HicB family nuclease/lambda repressor-like predicted transcriptional regulator